MCSPVLKIPVCSSVGLEEVLKKVVTEWWNINERKRKQHAYKFRTKLYSVSMVRDEAVPFEHLQPGGEQEAR